MKKILSNGIVSSLILIIFGVILMLKPGSTLTVVCTIIGWGLIVAGVVGIVLLIIGSKKGNNSDNTKKSKGAIALSIVKSVVAIVLGIILLTKSETIVSILPYIIGVLIIVNGAVNAIQAIIHRKESKGWIVTLICGIVTVIWGILIVANPFGAAASVVFMIGLSLVVDGLSNLFAAIFRK